jgi:hypothetical protein
MKREFERYPADPAIQLDTLQGCSLPNAEKPVGFHPKQTLIEQCLVDKQAIAPPAQLFFATLRRFQDEANGSKQLRKIGSHVRAGIESLFNIPQQRQGTFLIASRHYHQLSRTRRAHRS